MKYKNRERLSIHAFYSAFIILTSAFVLWVTDGTRTRDVQDHNLALYQLSYGHH